MKSSVDRSSTLGTVQWAVTYLLQEPVNDAVRQALREEDVTAAEGRPASREESSESGGSGPSALAIGIGLLVVGGLAYYARQRQQSSSEWSAESGSGSGSTRERRSGETAGSRGETSESGEQTTSVSDQG